MPTTLACVYKRSCLNKSTSIIFIVCQCVSVCSIILARLYLIYIFLEREMWIWYPQTWQDLLIVSKQVSSFQINKSYCHKRNALKTILVNYSHNMLFQNPFLLYFKSFSVYFEELFKWPKSLRTWQKLVILQATGNTIFIDGDVLDVYKLERALEKQQLKTT